MKAGKSRTGHFFEDFRVGMRLAHPTLRTLTDGDRSLYIALTGSRDLLSSARTASEQAGLERQPMEPFLVVVSQHVVPVESEASDGRAE